MLWLGSLVIDLITDVMWPLFAPWYLIISLNGRPGAQDAGILGTRQWHQMINIYDWSFGGKIESVPMNFKLITYKNLYSTKTVKTQKTKCHKEVVGNNLFVS